MRVNTQNTYLNHSNAGVESVKMSFDENSLAFLMDVMTNLYSDTDLAPIREYSSNALDSHKSAGVKLPIEVSLPTRQSPMFVVQDFGQGMSKDDLFNIYSKYGYSTKRDNDVETGMLGLGSKSGLTYTSQFTVTARKGGREVIATVARGTDGAGTINVLMEADTTESNGVTISIPVHNIEVFNSKALKFFRWWEQGTVLVDGREPAYPESETIKVSDEIIIHKRHSLDSDYVVMGCVAYPVGEKLSSGLPWGYHVVAYVPMGAVNFPPSREELQYTPKTNKVIDEINTRRRQLTKAVAEADIANAPTHADAVRALATWRPLLDVKAEYKGKEVPNVLVGLTRTSDSGTSYRQAFFTWERNRYRNKLNRRTSIETASYVDALVIVGFDNKNLSISNRRKIELYLEQQDFNPEMYVVAKEDFGGDWSEGAHLVDWSVIKAIKLPRSARQGSGTTGKFEVYEPGKGRSVVTDIEADDLIVLSPKHVNTEQRSWDAEYFYQSTLDSLWPDAVFPLLSVNRWEKFARENDNVRTINEAIKEYVEEFKDSLSDFEREVLTGNGYVFEPLGKLDPDSIDDPELSGLVEQVRGARDVREEWSKVASVYKTVHDGYRPEIEHVDATFRDILDRYPFLRYTDKVGIDHATNYANLVYADGKDNA